MAHHVTQRGNRRLPIFFADDDRLNRVTLKNLPGTEPDVSYAYDNLNRLTSASQTGNALSFTYDALGRKLTETGPLGTVTSQYDSAGNRTSLTATSYYFGYRYLVTGEIAAYLDPAGNAYASDAYDNLGRRTSTTMNNGGVQTYAYDQVSRLQTLTTNLSGTANDLTIGAMTYNPASQLTSAPRSNDVYAWTGGVNVNRNYTSNGLNQYTAAGAASFTYDPKGNLTSDGTNTFGYSSENLLTSGPNATTLTYDPLGRLYSVTSPSGTRKFLYDGLNPIEAFNATGTRTAVYAHGVGDDEPIVWWDFAGSGGAIRFLLSDERGSIVSLTDSTGAKVATNTYDEYGLPGAANAGAFQYTGQMWLPEIGVYYYKARMYSPTASRFLQTDPIGYADGANWYAYVGNDPVNLVDPLGLLTACVTGPGVDPSTGTVVEGTSVTSCGNVSDPNASIMPSFWGSSGGSIVLGGGTGFSGGGGGGGGTPQTNQLQQRLCALGNSVVGASSKAGDVSLGITGGGIAVGLTGVATGQPYVVGGGGALITAGGVFGLGAGALQVGGGLLQGLGGGGFGNAVKGIVSLGSGVLVSKGLQATIPRGWHGAAQARAQTQNSVVGNVVGALQGLADSLAPTQASCPK